MMERFLNAYNAMRALHIPVEEVKPVLKELLKVYDNNWQHIEAEDYRVLVDSYFDSKENKVVEDKGKNLTKDEVPERPSKRLHLEEQEGKTSSTAGNLKQIISVKEEGGTSMSCPEPRTKESSHLCPEAGRDKRIESSLIPHGLGKNVSSNHHGNGHFKQRTEEIKLDNVAEPTTAIHMSTCSASNCNKLSGSSFAIASSSQKQVKILLNCDFAVQQQKFQSADFNKVLNSLEDKYLRVDKLVSPQFSVMTLLTDLCESFLKIVTVSSKQPVGSNSSVVRKVGNSIHSPGSTVKPLKISNPDSGLRGKAPKPSGLSNSNNSVNMQQRTTASDVKMPFKKLKDITKGSENVKISLIDETGEEVMPKFSYIPQNIIYQSAYVQISLARIADEDCCSSCSGDCLARRYTCACARETGGEFAYTQQGLLTQEFLRECLSTKRDPQMKHFVFCQDCPLERSNKKCKGHLVRRFIKECWRKCGCDMKCGNRVVQRGITCNLQVFLTHEGKGWGVRTLDDLPAGSFVCEYVGEILTNTELYKRNMQTSGGARHTYPVTLDADWGSEKVLRDDEALCLDATFNGNVARFINHRCNDANLVDIPVEVETPDRHYYHLAFFTTRKVSAFEELTWDYGIDFDDHDHPIKAFDCCCGSDSCRFLKGKRRRS